MAVDGKQHISEGSKYNLQAQSSQKQHLQSNIWLADQSLDNCGIMK